MMKFVTFAAIKTGIICWYLRRFVPRTDCIHNDMALSDPDDADITSKYDAVLSSWRHLDRGWQATLLGIALVVCVHTLA